ncbi:efflux RND transporter permease subunit [Shumkonia mesophila]|uniref:efflux RND transporter permease subunit n=1 Tax=Shumkonia mesophila TaxID=2838854 RepID=UPI0029349C0F|nr:efflux RND transporter permease subunit [Shumkonia mesophila]
MNVPGASLLRGPVAWMVNNRVTPNLLMLVLLLGGLFVALQIKQEVFPEFESDTVEITVSYPGASPEEVERGIVLAVEEAVRGEDGVKEVSSKAAEDKATISVELLENADKEKAYQNIKQQVDRITTLPEDAEQPNVTMAEHVHEVVAVEIFGDVSEWALREVAEQVRDRLLADKGITQVDMVGTRDYEIHVEIPQANLRAYGLTLEGIATKIARTAVEVPGGSVKTSAGEILLRVKDRKDWARDFADIPVVTTTGGAVLRLADIATVRDDFTDSDQIGTYNGKRAIGLDVNRVGDQTPIGVSDATRRVLAAIEADLPQGVEIVVNRDQSEVYRQRLELLLKNAFMGLALVLVLLGIFLETKLAFWVTMGIPVSFLGSFLFLYPAGVSINMISTFAFIIALGIVVDDAIVAGENIYERRQSGMSYLEAAVLGVREVSSPIAFSILTNVITFIPLYFVPGVMGRVFSVIPVVVVAVFLVSWFEAVFILPAHLAHSRPHTGRLGTFIHRGQAAADRQLQRFIQGLYRPTLGICIAHRYTVAATAAVLLAVVIAYAASGRMGLVLMPRTESDQSVVTAVLPYGSPLASTTAVRDRLVGTAQKVAAENGGERLIKGIFATIDENEVTVRAYLTDPEVRPLSTTRMTEAWRTATGTFIGLESLKFESDRGGPGSGAALTVELTHRDITTLNAAAVTLAGRLAEFPQAKDIDDGSAAGKQQLDFKLLPEGQSLGLTAYEVARQVRGAFYGIEALRQQRGRNEVKVMVRLPENERVSEYGVEQLLIRAPSGRDVPLMQVAEVSRGRAYMAIERRNGQRTVTVEADVVPNDQTSRIQATLTAEILPALQAEYPGLGYSFEGHQAEISDSMQSLIASFIVALMGVYALLAIPFRSYIQPLIVMTAIPLGIVGAVLGHLIMGYGLSINSLMGVVALSGVVINDALVMIDFANSRCREGASPLEGIMQAGIRRFRPIMLTTLTTFGGLAPMIFETSRQARFMIPMALSLGYGILFATLITLLLVPCLYLINEDVTALFRSNPLPARTADGEAQAAPPRP